MAKLRPIDTYIAPLQTMYRNGQIGTTPFFEIGSGYFQKQYLKFTVCVNFTVYVLKKNLVQNINTRNT